MDSRRMMRPAVLLTRSALAQDRILARYGCEAMFWASSRLRGLWWIHLLANNPLQQVSTKINTSAPKTDQNTC